MRVESEGALLKFQPGNPVEAAQFDRLWKLIVGCVAAGKKLVPVGQYVPGARA